MQLESPAEKSIKQAKRSRRDVPARNGAMTPGQATVPVENGATKERAAPVLVFSTPDVIGTDSPIPQDTVDHASVRSLLVHGLLTRQVAMTDGVQLTTRASDRYLRQVAPFLNETIILTPTTRVADLNRDHTYFDSRVLPTLSDLLKEIAAARKAIDAKFNSLNGLLGGPIGQMDFGPKDSYFRNYEGGAIYLAPNGSIHEVHGDIYRKYIELGGVGGFLGYPQTDEQSTTFNTGRFNHFQGGSIYWTPELGAHAIGGAIRDNWWQLDGERGHLGFPVSDEEVWIDPTTGAAGGKVSYFQAGNIAIRSDGRLLVSNSSVVLKASLATSGVHCNVELWMNSAGDWNYKGDMRDSGFFGFNVTVASTLNFQDAAGNIMVFNVERHLDGTTSFGNDRSDDWNQVGIQDSFIRDNWEHIRFAGMRTHMDVDTTFGEVVQIIGTAFAVAVVVIVAIGTATGKNCPPRITKEWNGQTGRYEPSYTFDSVPQGEQCPN